MLNEKNQKKVKIICLILGTSIVVYLVFKYALLVFVPFIFAYFFTKLILPVSRKIKKKFGINELCSAIILLLCLMGILVTVVFFVLKIAASQLKLLIENIELYKSMLFSCLQSTGGCMDRVLGLESGQVYGYLCSACNCVSTSFRDKLMPTITQHSFSIAYIITKVIGRIVITFIAVVLMVKDYKEYKRLYTQSPFYEDVHKVMGKLSETGIAYLKTQTIIMFITATIMSGGLLLMKNKYALLIGISISILDAFPVLGCGLVLIPWAIISLLSKKIVHAAILITIYLICELVRQFLEPKLLGDRIGIHPVYMLMSLTIGVRLFGVLGFLLGPLALVIIVAVVKAYA